MGMIFSFVWLVQQAIGLHIGFHALMTLKTIGRSMCCSGTPLRRSSLKGHESTKVVPIGPS